MSWIQTSTGSYFDLLEPKPAQVRLEDVARALGRICRFAGHTKKHYSVAEHSVLVAQHAMTLRNYTANSDHRTALFMAGLLHDAHEAFTGDLTSPMKVALDRKLGGNFKGAYDDMIRAVDLAIVEALVPPYNRGPILLRELVHDIMRGDVIKEADLALLNTERAQLLGLPPKPWVQLPLPAFVAIEGWGPEEASERWLALYNTAYLALKESALLS